MAKKKSYRFFVYLAVRGLAAILYLMPRRLALAWMRFLAQIFSRSLKRQYWATLEHLRQAFGPVLSEKMKDEIAVNVMKNLAQTAAELLQFPKMNKRNLETIIDLGNSRKIYESLLQEGKGVISITAHIGNWELLAAAMSLQGFKGGVVARRIYYEPYNQWIVGLRQAVGVKTFYREHAARDIVDVLRRNEIIGLLPDQDINSMEGVFVNFFGRPAYTPIAPVRLSLATHSPILTNFMIRMPGDRYRWIMGGVIRPKVDTTREAAIQRYTEEWMQHFEQIIRQYPDQWAWMHDRWETKPEHLKKKAVAVSAE